jgi:multicomponent Na+:H+ antiporter subunit A
MAAFLLVFGLLSLVDPLLTRALSTRVFYLLVSQLGFLMVVVGFGSRDAALAGVALLIAHALYKAALFLVVGIIDTRAGTRDWRQLSGLGRKEPALALIALASVASMAGIPPLFGFVAKEAVFTAFTADGSGWGWIALAGTILTVAYSARFFWGAFARKPGRRSPPRSSQASLWSTSTALNRSCTCTC